MHSVKKEVNQYKHRDLYILFLIISRQRSYVKRFLSDFADRSAADNGISVVHHDCLSLRHRSLRLVKHKFYHSVALIRNCRFLFSAAISYHCSHIHFSLYFRNGNEIYIARVEYTAVQLRLAPQRNIPVCRVDSADIQRYFV